MKRLVFVVTLAYVAIQLTCAAPASENDKKEATGSASPGEAIDASPSTAEAKVKVVGITHAAEDAMVSRDASKEPAAAAAAAKKAQ